MEFSLAWQEDSQQTNHILSLLSKQLLKINANKFQDYFLLLSDGNASMKNTKKSKNTKSRTSSGTEGRPSDYISWPDFLRWEEHVLDCLLGSLRPFTRVYIDDKKVAQKSNRIRCSLLHPIFAPSSLYLQTPSSYCHNREPIPTFCRGDRPVNENQLFSGPIA